MGVVTASLSLAALTADAKDVSHRVLKALQNSGADVFFIGSELGLDGWAIVAKNGALSYAYTNAQGGLMNGYLFDGEGRSVTIRQLTSLKEKNPDLLKRIDAMVARKKSGEVAPVEPLANQPAAETPDSTERSEREEMLKNGQIPEAKTVKNSPKAEAAYKKVEEASWVAYGDKNAPYIYAFVNPTCPHCTEFLSKDIKDFVENGQLQVRFVPYGVHKENSDTTIAMLALDDPIAAWKKYIAGDKAALSVNLGTKESKAKTKANTKLASDMRFTALPFIIYRTPATGEIQVVNGRPENIMLLMSEFIQ